MTSKGHQGYPDMVSRTGVEEIEQEDKPVRQLFEFVDQSDINNASLRKKNRAKVRSHVVKRARQREQDGKKTYTIVLHKPCHERTIETKIPSTEDLGDMQQRLSRWSGPPCQSLSMNPISSVFLPNEWSPFARAMIHHTIFSASILNSSSDTISTAWQIFCTSRLGMHAAIYGAAAHWDAYNSEVALTSSHEGLTHRGEALRLMNEEVSAMKPGDIPSDALLFAVMLLTTDPLSDRGPSMVDTRTETPFRLPKTALGWQHTFLPLPHTNTHINGMLLLLARAGGLERVRNRSLAKFLLAKDIIVSMQALCAPSTPYFQVDEVAELVSKFRLSHSMPSQRRSSSDRSSAGGSPFSSIESDDGPGNSIPALKQSIGEMTLLATVLSHLQRVCVGEEVLARGELSKGETVAHLGDKEELHHTALCIPARPGSFFEGSLHEALRLTVLIFEVGILFPLPLSWGALARLIMWMKAELDGISEQQICDDMDRTLVWILFVGGVASKGMLEREWFVKRLRTLVLRHGLTRWAHLKQLLRSFIWLEEPMDEGAMELWDDVR